MKKIVLLLVIASLLLACSSSNVTQTTQLPPTTLTPNEEGLYKVITPFSASGGWLPEEELEYYLSNPDLDVFFTEVRLDPYGCGLIFYYTREQLEEKRQFNYLAGLLHKGYYIEEPVQSIVEIIYENEMLTEVTVLVDRTLYQNAEFQHERVKVNLYLVIRIANFQLLSGMAPYEWHTTITVLCYENGDLISRNSFPCYYMFNTEW